MGRPLVEYEVYKVDVRLRELGAFDLVLDRVRWEVTKPTLNTFFLDDTSIRLGTQAPTAESLEVARLTTDIAWGLNGLVPVSVSDRNAIWRAWLILRGGEMDAP